MKVAFVTHYTTLYGANRSLLDLIDGLSVLGVQAFVVVPSDGDFVCALKKRKIPFLIVAHQWWSSDVTSQDGASNRVIQYLKWCKSIFYRFRRNISFVTLVARQLREWNVDVIYTNSSVIPLGALVALWMGKPHIWHIREFGDLDYRLTYDWGKSLTNYFFCKAQAQIYNSEAISAHFAARVHKGKGHIVYNGVLRKDEMFELRERVNVKATKHDKFVFAIVGFIHPNKGQDAAIRALSVLNDSFSDVELIIAGDGGDAKYLNDLARNCGILEKVKFLGYVENPYEVFMQSDAVLMCSKYEAMGRVTVEAMAASKPVIGYKSGGTVELILHEFNGLLYEGGYRELAVCMRRFVERPQWAKEMGENGWRIATARFTIETYATKIKTIIEAVGNNSALQLPHAKVQHDAV